MFTVGRSQKQPGFFENINQNTSSPSSGKGRRSGVARMMGIARLFVIVLLALAVVAPAQAASLRSGLAAYERQDFNAAAAILRPLAIAGDPRAQSYVGYMYATGRG